MTASRRALRFFACLLGFFFLCAFPAHAGEWESFTAIAMHGTPKLPASFDHFPYANPTAPKGGALRLNLVGTFDSLNPYIVKGKPAEGMTYVYEPLMARSQDEPFTLYPLIAERVEIKKDRSAVRFYINQKARWQDGKPISADDLVFSWQVLKDKGRPNHRSYYKKVAKVDIESDSAVTFTFAKNDDGSIDREMPLIMGLMPVLPKHGWPKGNFDETTLASPLGSGPYRISAVDAGRSTTFTRIKDYWGKDIPSRKGLFNFDTIRYDYYRDENIAQEAFTAHQVDARRETDPTRWGELQRMAAQKDGIFRTLTFFHQRPEPFKGFIMNARRAPFSNPLVREALTYAFDFDWMNRTLFRSAYKRTESYFANSELAAAGTPDKKEQALLAPFRNLLPAALFEKPFSLPRNVGNGPAGSRDNLRRALALLEEAGYTVQNGTLRDTDGAPLSFEIMLSDPQDEKIALEFTRALERIGVDARVRTIDAAQFQSRLNDFDYDVVLFRWVNSLSPGNEQAIYWGSAAADAKGSRNYAGIKNPAVDALASAITAAITREDLRAAVHALDRVLLWNYYAIPLFYRGADLFAIWPNIATPHMVPLYGPVVESWWAKN